MTARCAVLHVLINGDVGGTERIVHDLVAVQKHDPGIEAGILFLQTPAGGFEPEFRALGVALHSLGLTSGLDFSLAKLRQAVVLLRHYRVIHMHVFNAWFALAAIIARKPVIVTLHGILAQGRVPRLTDRVNIWLMRRFLMSHVSLITCNSEYTRRIAQDRFGLEGVACEIIYNGIVLDESVRADSAIDPGTAARITSRFVVGTAARFADVKRIDRLIAGFALFARGRPDALLLLVGDGALRGRLEREVREAGIEHQTVFAGFRANVRAYQRAMTVFVLPSVSETFGLGAIEAMALGSPAIVFADGGGAAEVIGAFSGADVVKSVAELAVRLEFYHGHRDVLAEGAAGRRAYAARFDIALTALEFRRHYQAFESCAA